MRRLRHLRTGLSLAVTLGLLLAGSVATARAADGITPPSWSDRTLGPAIELDGFTGELPPDALSALIAEGERLFALRFTRPDGAGRPLATQAILPTAAVRSARRAFARTAGPDANACTSCHNVPRPGGSGDFTANAFVSEGFVQADFDTTDPQFSNERNTNHLFGAGLVELLAREMTASLHAIRDNALAAARKSGRSVTRELRTKGVEFGRVVAHPDGLVDTDGYDGIDSDLVVRPFGHKGVIVSLRQFTVNALNFHHGMQATERFGARWTDRDDFDGDGVADEIRDGHVSALVAWQASLAPPDRREDLPSDWRHAAARGERLFDTLGCTDCHRPALPLDSLVFTDPGPYDTAGTMRSADLPSARQPAYDLASLAWVATLPRDASGRVLVPLYGDLKRHVIADARVSTFGNEQLAQRFVERDVFMTTELWGVASTAPYGHRGDLTTLADAIDGHGGAARATRDAWRALPRDARDDVDAFLKSLAIAP